MIRFIAHTDIDKKAWDACIDKSQNKYVYAYSWFLDIVSPNWNALVEGNYKTIMPLTQSKKYTIHYLYQPPYTQQLGVFSNEEITEKTIEEFIQHIPNEIRFTEINFNIDNTIKPNSDYIISERVTHLLDLNCDYSVIQKKYSENLKRNIKKAIKNNLQLSTNIGISELINLFESNKGKTLAKGKDKQNTILKKLHAELNARNSCMLVGVRDDKQHLSAGALFVKSDEKIIFLFSATNNKAKESGAMSFIIDSVIQQYSNQNLIFDFEGSMDNNLARFYASFGSDRKTFPFLKINKLPKPIMWLKK